MGTRWNINTRKMFKNMSTIIVLICFALLLLYVYQLGKDNAETVEITKTVTDTLYKEVTTIDTVYSEIFTEKVIKDTIYIEGEIIIDSIAVAKKQIIQDSIKIDLDLKYSYFNKRFIVSALIEKMYSDKVITKYVTIKDKPKPFSFLLVAGVDYNSDKQYGSLVGFGFGYKNTGLLISASTRETIGLNVILRR